LEASQAESVIATLKEDLAASQAQCNSLKLRNEELEEQYSLLWSSTSHPSKVKGDSSASTSKGCDRCHHIDIESYATNLANMEAVKKEIARLNSIIARGCMGEENKRAKFTKSVLWLRGSLHMCRGSSLWCSNSVLVVCALCLSCVLSRMCRAAALA
jgi:hypothetical protein